MDYQHSHPTTNGCNGCRDSQGRFIKGNPGGPGNPHVKKVAKIRQAMFEVVDEHSVQIIIKELVKNAIAGDLIAAKIVMGYVLGN